MHNILAANQFGFREKHSTFMALLNLVDRISGKIDNKEYSIGIFMDLSKAFDTVDHGIFLDKLELYGVRGVALKWFKSYLEHRSQFVQINNIQSSMLPITCGVPQGSILGPLLFIVYINDIIHVSDIADIMLFADDTNMFFSRSSFDTLLTLVNNELLKISKWFKLNKLSLNIKKTNYILFRSKRKALTDRRINIAIDGINILEVTKIKFLGVVINQTLTWNDHIMIIKQKIAKNVGILTRVRYCIPRCVLLSLYHVLIELYLMYCNIVWATQNTVALNSLLLCQKRVVRIITFSHWLSHTKPIFKKYCILTVCDINWLQVARFMFSIMYNLTNQYKNRYTNFINVKVILV
jgi:hypothetical protein